MNTLNPSFFTIENVICPCCKTNSLTASKKPSFISCTVCSSDFPFINGIPVLINEKESIFKHSDFLNNKNLFFDISAFGKVKAWIANAIPSMSTSNSKANFKFLKKLLVEGQERPRVLILGGSIVGVGMKEFISSQEIEFVESDVSFGPRTQVILDAHTIPFENETFDCVIAQAVLEHVIDPIKCENEIRRVLKPKGFVYSEIPFMQQVHGSAYDFTRYSLSGHRYLFKYFEEVKSGAVSGSGTVMAWSYQYLLLGLFGYTKQLRYLVKVIARITGFWLKYFDYLQLVNKYYPDGASGTFFLGKKGDKPIEEKELIQFYFKRIS